MPKKKTVVSSKKKSDVDEVKKPVSGLDATEETDEEKEESDDFVPSKALDEGFEDITDDVGGPEDDDLDLDDDEDDPIEEEIDTY